MLYIHSYSASYTFMNQAISDYDACTEVIIITVDSDYNMQLLLLLTRAAENQMVHDAWHYSCLLSYRLKDCI